MSNDRGPAWLYDDDAFDNLLDEVESKGLQPYEREGLSAGHPAHTPSGRVVVALTSGMTRNARCETDKRLKRAEFRPSDLPALEVPPGYFRDGRGCWRRRPDRQAVPGAKDVTISSVWSELVDRAGTAWIPLALALGASELSWVPSVGERTDSSAGPLYRVDREDWDARCGWPLTISAPELAPSRLVGVAEIADCLSVKESTVSAYLARGRLPEPTYIFSGRPKWAWPILLQPSSPLLFKLA